MRKRNNSQCLGNQNKRIKRESECDEDIKNEQEEKPTPFKPRLLRVKKKENYQKVIFNNNNDEWVKHRRELENKQHR